MWHCCRYDVWPNTPGIAEWYVYLMRHWVLSVLSSRLRGLTLTSLLESIVDMDRASNAFNVVGHLARGSIMVMKIFVDWHDDPDLVLNLDY